MKGTTLRFLLLGTAGLGLSLTSCNSGGKTNGSGTSTDSTFHGLHVSYMDTTVKPNQDFWAYANGSYLKTTEIPDEYSSWGVFNELRDNNDRILKDVLQKAADDKSAAAGSNRQKLGDFWATGMDSAKIDAAGITPIKAQLDQIDAIQDAKGILDMVVWMHRHRMSPLFYLYADQDARNNTEIVANMGQAGLGLPERDYYFNPAHKEIRTQYLGHISKMLSLAGMDSLAAGKEAKAIMDLETALANASMPITELRDPVKTYNKMNLADLQKTAPNFDWAAYFTGIGLTKTDVLIIGQPKFFAAASNLLKSTPIPTWKSYLRWHLLHEVGSELSSPFVAEDFRFNQQVLNGVEKLKPRWKRVVEKANFFLGEALGEEYVKVAFSPEAKTKALDMVKNILDVMKDRLGKLDWMGAETRAQAIKKVETIMPKIGYPDKWRDYSKMTLSRDSWVGNVLAGCTFSFDYNMNKIGKPVDKTEWGMPPQIVNAYYNPLMNEIVFPAGILQSPFFDVKVDDALNYGGFGAVIGHELIHAFDDQGSQFDASGNLNNWWTDADRTNFMARAQKVVEQYSAYTVLDSLHVNGQLTLGENIADIDGLRISLEALGRALGDKKDEKIDGFTSTQRFFINYGHIWAGKMRDEALKVMIATNPHSPAECRVRGSVSNRPEFYEAFGVKPGDPLYRADSIRIQIW